MHAPSHSPSCTPPLPASVMKKTRAKAGPRVLKVKVGGIAGPSEDAARTVQLLRESGSLGGSRSSSSSISSTLRLDANQAWTMDEALQFSAALGDAAATGAAPAVAAGRINRTRVGVAGGTEGGGGVEGVDLSLVEYIEEPLREPRSLGKFWERSGGVVPYALDESLAMGREKFTDKVTGQRF